MEAKDLGNPRFAVQSTEASDLVSGLLQAAAYVKQRLNEFLARYELTEGRYFVLTELERAGRRGLSQAELADRLLQSESNISSLIERLHRDGLVNRNWSEADRRKRVLQLTDLGRDIIQQIESARRNWAETLLANLSGPDRKELWLSLMRLPGNLGKTPTRDVAPPAEAPKVSAELWTNRAVVIGLDPGSPHVALERMLSTLGLAGRFAEDMP